MPEIRYWKVSVTTEFEVSGAVDPSEALHVALGGDSPVPHVRISEGKVVSTLVEKN